MHTKRTIFTGVIFFALTADVLACPECRAKVEIGIYNHDFWVNLLVILLPIIVLTGTGVGLYFADDIMQKIKAGTS